MSVRFNEKNLDHVPKPRREAYQAIIRQALDVSRPDGENWVVTTNELVDSAVVRFDFERGTGAPRSFTFAPEGDDERHTQLFRTACQFLRTNC